MAQRTEGSLVDSKGRVASKLRVSVTDRCNFACLFCMPDKGKVDWLPIQDILDFPGVERVVRTLSELGVDEVRVTGGEPLLRNGVETLVKAIADIPSVRSVAMTTNGWFLAKKAKALKEAGLGGVTVSLHSLRRERFGKISGADALPRVVEGIDAAISAGLSPVKVNSVAIKGYNDDEVLDLVDFAHSRGISIRFIEFMPLDGLGIWSAENMMTGKEILEKVSGAYGLVPMGRKKGSTARLWGLPDGKSDFGLITPMSDPFCDDCDRLRLTADGKLLSCLFDTQYYDLKPLLKGDDAALKRFIIETVRKKPDGVAYMPWIREGWAKPRNMNAIGG